MTIYDHFVEFTNERYPLCTLTEKLEAYLLHFGAKAVPFLQELIEKNARVHSTVEAIYEDAKYTSKHEDPGPELKGYLQTVRGHARGVLDV